MFPSLHDSAHAVRFYLSQSKIALMAPVLSLVALLAASTYMVLGTQTVRVQAPAAVVMCDDRSLLATTNLMPKLELASQSAGVSVLIRLFDGSELHVRSLTALDESSSPVRRQARWLLTLNDDCDLSPGEMVNVIVTLDDVPVLEPL